MHLTQIQPNDIKKIDTINSYLKENFKMIIKIDSDLDDIKFLRENTKAKIHELKYVYGCTAKDMDLAKNLAILEVSNLIINSKRVLKEDTFENDYEDYEEKIEELSKVVAKYVRLGDDLDFAISVAMREYRGSKYLRADYDVERDLREKVSAVLTAAKSQKRIGGEVGVEEGGDFYHPDSDYGSTNPAKSKRNRSSAAASRDVPTVYNGRGKKAVFAPRDSGRETTPARSKLNMSEGKYICLAEDEKMSFNNKTMKGNCIALTGANVEGQDISYPLRVRFVVSESEEYYEINIDSILDHEGAQAKINLSEEAHVDLSENILKKLIEKGI